MENKVKAKQYEYITLLHIVSMIAVVCLHTNGCFWIFSATAGYWASANVIECLFYFAVPVFYMLTGATLMDYSDRYSTTVFYKRRAEKILVPYVFWSVVGSLLLSLFGRHYEFSWGGGNR